MDILVITTGGTFDKVYFDAKSDYQVGEPYVGNLLDEGNVTLNYEILSILKKDSLDIKEEDRILIKDKVSSGTLFKYGNLAGMISGIARSLSKSSV